MTWWQEFVVNFVAYCVALAVMRPWQERRRYAPSDWMKAVDLEIEAMKQALESGRLEIERQKKAIERSQVAYRG